VPLSPKRLSKVVFSSCTVSQYLVQLSYSAYLLAQRIACLAAQQLYISVPNHPSADFPQAASPTGLNWHCAAHHTYYQQHSYIIIQLLFPIPAVGSFHRSSAVRDCRPHSLSLVCSVVKLSSLFVSALLLQFWQQRPQYPRCRVSHCEF
jgi:hypothetical protein